MRDIPLCGGVAGGLTGWCPIRAGRWRCAEDKVFQLIDQRGFFDIPFFLCLPQYDYKTLDTMFLHALWF
jgi:hypothetical protein